MLSKNTKPKSWQTYKRLLSYIRPIIFIFIFALICNGFYSAIDAFIIKLLQPLIDDGFIHRNHFVVKYILWLLPSIFLLRGLGSFGANYSMFWISRYIIKKLRAELFTKYLFLPVGYFEQQSSGKLLSKLIYNIDQIASATTDAITDFIRQGCLIIALIIVMLSNSWRLTLIFLTIAPVVVFLFMLSSRHFRRKNHDSQYAMEKLSHIANESIIANKIVKIFNSEQYEINRFSEALSKYNSCELKVALIKSISIPIIQFFGGCALTITIYFALTQTGAHMISAGSFTSLFTCMIAILKPVKQMTNVNSILQRGIAGAENIFNILDQNSENDRGKYSKFPVHGDIELKKLIFEYTEGKNILNKLNLKIKAGESIAFVGPSGAGKTTLMNLLLRFYCPTNGNITIDNIDIQNYKLANLRKNISMVTQSSIVFNATIAENIAYGESKIDQKRLLNAAKAAYALEFIEKLPNKFDTLIGENGQSFSGGQLQRLSIARAIYKNAKIIIFDEATSALDNKSEKYVQQALHNLMQNHTLLIIAHRFSTVLHADRIIVMNEGNIVEEGDHKALLANKSLYWQLYNAQFSTKHA